jgi:6,7-dimethyl-8-ribityllumazine synthase
MRSAVPVDVAVLSTEQITRALRREAVEFLA